MGLKAEKKIGSKFHKKIGKKFEENDGDNADTKEEDDLTPKPADENKTDSKGVIYILKNPSFPDYVKIGYADDLESRLKYLNNSECTPFAFRVYATYEVDTRLSDLKIHAIIDKINPNLRSIDNYNGKKRIREFYAMSAEDAYLILEAIAEIHNCTDRLKKWGMSVYDVKAEAIADEVDTEKQARSVNFSFSECKIPIGARLINIEDPSIYCIVADNRRIEYNGETMYITPFVKMISGKNNAKKGTKYFMEHFQYNGELLKTICEKFDMQ